MLMSFIDPIPSSSMEVSEDSAKSLGNSSEIDTMCKLKVH